MRLACTAVLGALLAACAILSPGDRVVELHGHRVEVASAGSGSPTIVLESGLGDGLEPWRKVLPALAKLGHVFTYSRPGYDRSEWTGAPRDAGTVAQELHQLLEAAGERPPYVLVGHSLGGLYVQAYAARYPSEVAGLVLVDSSHSDQVQRTEAEAPREAKLLAALTATFVDPMRAEFHALGAGQLRFDSERPYAGPVMVLAADHVEFYASSQFAELHARLEREIAARYPAAELRHVDSHHYIQRERPQAVISAVADILHKSAP